jgi:CDP-diacylglycerol--glycerol-3-phosphate 3-phosphatidyltransferase
MAKILSVVSRAGVARAVDPVARALVRAGITPNTVTVLGTIGVLVGAIGFGARGHLIVGVIVVTLSCFTDMIDGSMARIKGVSSKFGALLDSSMDRVADAAIFGVVAYLYAVRDQPRVVAAAVLALALGQVVSYVKARAEGLGATCNVGLVERTERLIIVGVGGLLTGLGVEPALEIALWVLVALSLFTVWQRMRHVYLQMERAQ